MRKSHWPQKRIPGSLEPTADYRSKPIDREARMARAAVSIEELVSQAVSQSIRRIAPAIQRHVAALAASELERNLAVDSLRGARRPGRRVRPEDISRWVADNNARRVPKFVIEATGLDTKKKIVAKFGPNATFEKGKPLPKTIKA
jgi:hypothetical protein